MSHGVVAFLRPSPSILKTCSLPTRHHLQRIHLWAAPFSRVAAGCNTTPLSRQSYWLGPCFRRSKCSWRSAPKRPKSWGKDLFSCGKGQTEQCRQVHISQGVTQHLGRSPSDFGHLTEEEYLSYPERVRPLSGSQIAEVFGSGVTVQEGNETLQILQKQRVTGTLDQGLNQYSVSETKVTSALRWLRQEYPLDEDAAILRRIELEDEQAGKELLANAEKWRFEVVAHQPSPLSTAENGEEQQNGDSPGSREEQGEIMPTSSPVVVPGSDPRPALDIQREARRPKWVLNQREKAILFKGTVSDLQKISKTKRLLPSTVFTALVISLCMIFANCYTPPPRSARIFPDVPPAAATIFAIMSTNVMFFVVWKLPFAYRFMNKYFLLVTAMPRAISILGNTFSHQSFTHLLSNMAGLWLVGPKLHDEIGRGNFLAIYISSGVFGSYISLARQVLSNNLLLSSLGASGAALGIVSAWLCLNYDKTFTLPFRPFDMPLWISPRMMFAVLVGLEVIAAFRGVGRIDHFSHLGGFFFGAFEAEYFRAGQSKQ